MHNWVVDLSSCMCMCITCILYMCIIRVRGVPLNGIFDPCAGACWWLLGVVVDGSSCVARRRHVPVPLWGPQKSTKIDKIDNFHKIHAPKIQGCVFSEGAEAPQAAATQTHRAGGPRNRQER